MNIRFGAKQNLTELAEDLKEIVEKHKEQPAPNDWEMIRQLLEDNYKYLDLYIIPRTPDVEPGYKSTRIAPLVVPQRPDLEVKEEISSTGAPFLAQR